MALYLHVHWSQCFTEHTSRLPTWRSVDCRKEKDQYNKVGSKHTGREQKGCWYQVLTGVPHGDFWPPWEYTTPCIPYPDKQALLPTMALTLRVWMCASTHCAKQVRRGPETHRLQVFAFRAAQVTPMDSPHREQLIGTHFDSKRSSYRETVFVGYTQGVGGCPAKLEKNKMDTGVWHIFPLLPPWRTLKLALHHSDTSLHLAMYRACCHSISIVCGCIDSYT